MQIHIRDLLAKSDWAAKLGTFLHDAAIHERFIYDEQASRISLKLARIGYELRVHEKALFFQQWRMPSVPCVLSLSPVRILRVQETADAWTGWGEQLTDLSVTQGGQCELTTREAVLTLEGLGPVDLVLSDSGTPSDTLNHTDFGALVVPEWLIVEVVSTHEA